MSPQIIADFATYYSTKTQLLQDFCRCSLYTQRIPVLHLERLGFLGEVLG
jgi:hypothetical protein